MQPRVDLGDLWLGNAESLAVAAHERLRRLAAAGEAGAVAGGERGNLVEEEELGPAGTAAAARCGPSRAALVSL